MSARHTIWILAMLAVPASGDDWPHLGRDDGRTRLPAETITSPASLAAAATGGSTAASPAVADGYIVTADLEGASARAVEHV